VKPTKLELMQFFIQCVRVDAARIGPAEVRMRYGVDPERCRMSLRGAAIRPSSCPVRPILHVRTGISGGGTLFGARERVAAVPFDCQSAGAGVARPASHWAHATALTKKWRLKELAKRAHAQQPAINSKAVVPWKPSLSSMDAGHAPFSRPNVEELNG
jgi:hypothetical protein